jgi:hypothetical protein
MRRETISRWFVGGLLMVAVALAFPVTAPADDVQDNQKHERRLQADARQLDADAARASSTPDGQRRVTERIAKEFKVQPSVVTDLRSRLGGYGQATIALALSQDLMKRDKTLSQQAALDKIVALRQAGKGWGVIAHEQGVKLGHVVSEVKRAEKATEHVAGKPDKVAKAEKAEKAEKPEKPEKFEKPAKPEKPGR